MKREDIRLRIMELLAHFKLPTCAAQMVARLEKAGHDEALAIVREVLELEAAERLARRVQRLRKLSRLPHTKTFETFDQSRLARPLVQRMRELATGAFVERSENILIFGLPGVGKTHVACALGDALIQGGRSVLFVPTYQLVQQLLAARRDLALPRTLRQLDAFEVLILDDLGYVQQNADEAEVLFTLMAERYERRSLVITSNLVFSQWERIFKNPMATAAAVDRLVHHATILELDLTSYRTEDAKKKAKNTEGKKSEETKKNDDNYTAPQGP
jgi:DNA replication protein DnaC